MEQVIGASAAPTALTASETDLIGLALSGFSDSRNHLWRNACADVLGRLHNPYLRLMFKFLTVARGDFSSDVDFMEILVRGRLHIYLFVNWFASLHVAARLINRTGFGELVIIMA